MKTLDNKSIGIIEEYMYALQQRNLVYNSDFRYFSNQIINGSIDNYGIPDGWCYEDKGKDGNINFDTINDQCIIIKSSDSSLMNFKQALH